MAENKKRTIEAYEDMLHMPHHQSPHRPKMTMGNRAAQFAPFSAVVGYDQAVKEAGRYTVMKKELDEMEMAVIDHKLREIEARLSEGNTHEFVYFVPDQEKAGGAYVTLSGVVKKIDTYKQVVVLGQGDIIPIEAIYAINI